MFKIQFLHSDLMWDFIDDLHLTNYNANNSIATVELDEKYWDKEDLAEKAKKYHGELI